MGGWRVGAGAATFGLVGESRDRCFVVLCFAGADEMGAAGEGWNAGKEGVGEVMLDTVESWARQGRRNAGERMKD